MSVRTQIADNTKTGESEEVKFIIQLSVSPIKLASQEKGRAATKHAHGLVQAMNDDDSIVKVFII